ncbi:hypothetical protein GRS96_12540 [Rathayibacter sp. VKM Ac-2803]|uniref:helix-turn-helix domain-containing protein n=1 Tax=Rathayibacter sp. VKM Ac-2803 TaxID=2609256 RepID=UPI00135B1263|nr:helix-turn-helix domain-containing protein [Rathayibacter sp. VKM Ac-2803]MWV50097.1 hypothetical protein [Rathayibacter sp. VKM Ac-2803]
MTHQTAAIAEEVRAAIARRRMPQVEVARILGLSQSGVSRRLAGFIDFTAPELGTLAAALAVPVASLFGEGLDPSEIDQLASTSSPVSGTSRVAPAAAGTGEDDGRGSPTLAGTSGEACPHASPLTRSSANRLEGSSSSVRPGE